MKTASYNLVDEPWLPVTLADDFPGRSARGLASRVSLREMFEHGDRIVDLRCYPHERIALMRLLICITQRALNGPATEEEWKTCRSRIASAATEYLETHKACFNLFGDGPRFLQMRTANEPSEFSVQKLVFIDEDGTTLFDGHARPDARLSTADLAVALIAFQSFAAGGRVAGAAESLSAGVCREASALHSFLVGAALSESVWLNLVPLSVVTATGGRAFGDPSWESETVVESYLFRLAPTARYLWLLEGGGSVQGRGGRALQSVDSGGAREHTVAIVASRRRGDRDHDAGDTYVLSATAGGGVPKAAWRELHALAVLRSADLRGGPSALQHGVTLRGAGWPSDLRLWCGALVGGGKGRAAAVGDVVESVFRLPIQFLEESDTLGRDDPRRCPGPNQTYRKGVAFADYWAARLQGAVAMYRKALKDADKGNRMQHHVAARFWTALEQKAESVLLHDVAVHSESYWSDAKDWLAKSPWGREVVRAARDAYEFACPHTTARQLHAYAIGLGTLFGKDRVKPEHDVDSPDEGDQ